MPFPPGKGAMAAILGIDPGVVAAACRDARGAGVVSSANFNAPDQTVIAGEAAAVQKASDNARALGARRVLPLAVSAPFHCELMAPARDRLAADLQELEFRDPVVSVICNVDAAEVTSGHSARDCLVRQVCSPVRWVETIQHLVACGVDTLCRGGAGQGPHRDDPENRARRAGAQRRRDSGHRSACFCLNGCYNVSLSSTILRSGLRVNIRR